MNVIIINFRNLKIGGIENYLYGMLKNISQSDTRLIWFCDKNAVCADEYKDVFLSNKVERYVFDTHGIKWGKIPENLTFNNGDVVRVYSFFFLDYLRMEMLRSKNIILHNFLAIPHFAGAVYYPEEEKNIFFKKLLLNKTTEIYKKMLANKELKCFDNKHIETIEQKYNINIKKEDNVLISDIEPIFKINPDQIVAKHNNDIFNIITISRFEFPHKAFVIGMIDVFDKLAKKYPNIHYNIVGYGKDENIVVEKINSLDDDVKERIHFIGKLPPDKLQQVLLDASVNVSIAGSASLGASLGVISLPCRHYCYDCETYGYYAECKEILLSDKPGKDITPFIEEVINSSDDKFLELSKRDYDKYYEGYNYNPTSFNEYETKVIQPITKKDINYFKLYNLHCKMNYFISKIIK